VVFCELNGHEPDLTDDDAFDLVMEVASTAMELGDIVVRLRLREL